LSVAASLVLGFQLGTAISREIALRSTSRSPGTFTELGAKRPPTATPSGDGESTQLRSAIRAHAHFSEYVPIIALMVAMLEISGLPALRVHILMAALLVARLLHPLGMYAKPQTLQFFVGRVGGMTITISVMIASAVLILWRLCWADSSFNSGKGMPLCR
jgi:uncharacterized protein